jgi:hypothetical protein
VICPPAQVLKRGVPIPGEHADVILAPDICAGDRGEERNKERKKGKRRKLGHRILTLNRASTPEEEMWLAEGDSCEEKVERRSKHKT